jgi:hypothetical protein
VILTASRPRRLGEPLVDVQGEFERRQGTGGFDPIVVVSGQAGQHVVDHRRVGRDIGQLDGTLAGSGVFGDGGRATPALMAYSSTAPVKVARQPPRTS